MAGFPTAITHHDGYTTETSGNYRSLWARVACAFRPVRETDLFPRERISRDPEGRLHNPNGPAYEVWMPPEDGMPGRKVREDYALRGTLHRDPREGPAHRLWDSWSGEESTAHYITHGKPNRDPKDGPAIVERDLDPRTGRNFDRLTEYRVGGVLHRHPEDGMARIWRASDGDSGTGDYAWRGKTIEPVLPWHPNFDPKRDQWAVLAERTKSAARGRAGDLPGQGTLEEVGFLTFPTTQPPGAKPGAVRPAPLGPLVQTTIHDAGVPELASDAPKPTRDPFTQDAPAKPPRGRSR